ncbi:unnamed protein product [Meganyctiphanes norvegica]|uniref:Uncharacterized protein n=1 Tax=Meganyctiphanes norvegica TaxID=48144 RepID=A0AAV2PLS3_MEGNR
MKAAAAVAILATVIMATSVATAYPQMGYGSEYDGGEEYEMDVNNEDVAVQPRFTSTPQHFKVEIGDDITLPCQLTNIGDYKLFFKHSREGRDKTIYVGDVEIDSTKKFTKDGNSFTLNKVRRSDAGEYVCRVEAAETIEITHILDVQYPAKVMRVSEEMQHVEAGASVTLECKAEGNPAPAITWSKQEGHMPSGKQSEEGTSIILEDVNRHSEGKYICTASNGIGEATSTSMEVMVNYKPEINTEQALLHSGEGDSANLVCIVHGRPTPHVTWTRGNQPLTIDSHIDSHDGAHRHTLTITPVGEEDFGDYTCTAKNDHGDAESTLTLTGLPKAAILTSDPNGGEETSYTLTWKTDSYSTPTMYRVKYRKVKGARGQSPSEWVQEDSLLSGEEGQRMESQGQSHHMSHTLKHLQPVTDYEASISVENKFGWSPESEQLFQFHTRKEEPSTSPNPVPESFDVQPLKKDVSQGLSASSCTHLEASMTLAALALLAAIRL